MSEAGYSAELYKKLKESYHVEVPVAGCPKLALVQAIHFRFLNPRYIIIITSAYPRVNMILRVFFSKAGNPLNVTFTT